MIYDAHLTAMETELKYAFNKKDYFWVKIRLRIPRESVLDDDPNLPEEMRPRAEAIFERFSKAVKYRPRR